MIDGAEDVGGVTGPASVSSQVIDTQELMLRSGVAFASGDQWVLAWGPRVVYVFHRASNSSATRAGLPSGLPPRLGAMSPGALLLVTLGLLDPCQIAGRVVEHFMRVFVGAVAGWMDRGGLEKLEILLTDV